MERTENRTCRVGGIVRAPEGWGYKSGNIMIHIVPSEQELGLEIRCIIRRMAK